MRIARFLEAGRECHGVIRGDDVSDVSGSPELAGGIPGLLAGGSRALAALHDAAARARRVPLADVRLLAPIARPPKFLAIGLNYADHVKEAGLEPPTFPVFFNKQTTCVVGPGDAIHRPRVSALLDYEGELGVVIGRRCRHVPAERAREVIGGYLVVNDVTVRDWQFKAPTMTLGKSFDTHGPIGPWLVTADEIADPQDLRIRTWVNGELVQDASTREMIFGVAEQIATLSTAFTLEPGDVISTGTPAGVGIVRKPMLLLKAGDVVRVEVEGVGAIENPVIDEPEDTAIGMIADEPGGPE
ncbi:MAG TPA: fumarylacetoacetate hydrolase family protein [Burkholderiales bacterium]|nr:fumarylacetoacetate hydrolase family protein [Burkholderiales bacterium]